MEPERLAELVDHAVGADAPADVRERAGLAIEIAEKVGRQSMRVDAANKAVDKKRIGKVREIVKAEIMGIEV